MSRGREVEIKNWRRRDEIVAGGGVRGQELCVHFSFFIVGFVEDPLNFDFVLSLRDGQTCTIQSQSISLGKEVGRKVNCTMLRCTQTQAIRR